MDEQLSKKQKLRRHLGEKFRLVILNDETLKEVSNYRLNLINIYLFISTLFILCGLIALAVIIYTPVKYLIPNYGEVTANSDFVALMKKTDELEKEIAEITTYLDGNKNRLYGNSNNSSTPIELDGAYKPQSVELSPDHDHQHHESDHSSLENFLFVAPMRGTVSSAYSKDSHQGIDIVAPLNTTVVSIADGYVISADYTFDTGNTIGIQHANNLISFYKHNAKLLKRTGEFVSAGEAIAIAGNTGELTDGPHLHFELWLDGVSVDPNEYIEF